MKTYYFLFLLFFLVSCNEEKVIDIIPIPQSSLVELQYKTGSGNSSTEVTNLLGYGFDATGFCDTISARAKILDLADSDHNIYMGNPNSFFPLLISGRNWADFSGKINNSDITNFTPLALSSHLKALYKLAFNKDTINPDNAYAYFASTCLYSHYHLYTTGSDIKTTSSFDDDVVSLTPKELISKYGTHVLTDVMIGSKVEVLYRCVGDAQTAEQGIYRRMNQFLGGAAGIIYLDQSTAHNAKDEQLIYNTIGSKVKMCGLINATDNNPEKISKNLYSAFGDNIKIQFMQIGKDGLLPLYEVIKDSSKKHEIKDYIEKYLSTTTID